MARSRRPGPVLRLQLSIARCACSGDIALGNAGVVVQAATPAPQQRARWPLHRDTARNAGTIAWRSRRTSVLAVADVGSDAGRTRSLVGTQCAQIDQTVAETLVEKPPDDRSVALDRYGRQPLLILEMSPIAGRQIVSRRDLDTGRRARSVIAQELQ